MSNTQACIPLRSSTTQSTKQIDLFESENANTANFRNTTCRCFRIRPFLVIRRQLKAVFSRISNKEKKKSDEPLGSSTEWSPAFDNTKSHSCVRQQYVQSSDTHQASVSSSYFEKYLKSKVQRNDSEPALLKTPFVPPLNLKTITNNENVSTENVSACDSETVTLTFHTPRGEIKSYLSILEEARSCFHNKQSELRLKSSCDSELGKLQQDLANLMIEVSYIITPEIPVDWTLIFHKESLKIWRCKDDSCRLRVRTFFVVPASPSEYSRLIYNAEYRKLWDATISKLHTIEKISQNCEIAYLATKRVATLFPRDSINLKIMKPIETTTENAIYACASCSIEHPDYPEETGYTRMDLHLSTCVAFPLHTPFGLWSKVYTISDADFKGWISPFLLRKLTTCTLPLSLEKQISWIMNHLNIDYSGGSAMSYVHQKLVSASIPVSI